MVEVGIYVRVSTEEQAQDGYSVRGQEQKLRDYSRIREWHVYKVYIDDGISGKNITERPAINELIQDIKDGKVNNVLVFKIDRLTRNTADLIYLVNLFNEHDCAFNSLSESIDTQTPSGRMFIKIIGIFAEFERENIIERSKLGFERKAREGYTLATRVTSYGYDKKPGEKVQTINEYEASIVREVFDMFVHQNKSCLEIARILNERGVPTKENAKWYSRSIKNMLTNCNYIGMVRYSVKDPNRGFETEGSHQPIISKELYEEARTMIEQIGVKSYTKRPREECYFLGILYCAKCGGKMVSHCNYLQKKGDVKRVRVDYRCRNYLHKTCKSSIVNHQTLEEAFREYIAHIEEFSAADSLSLSEQQEKQIRDEELLKGLYRKVKVFEQKEKDIMASYLSDSISIDDYTQLKGSIEEGKALVLAKIQELEKEKAGNNDEKVKREDIIRNLRENWDLLTNEEKRQFLLKFVDKIIVFSEKDPHNKRKNIVKIEDVQFHTF